MFRPPSLPGKLDSMANEARDPVQQRRSKSKAATRGTTPLLFFAVLAHKQVCTLRARMCMEPDRRLADLPLWQYARRAVSREGFGSLYRGVGLMLLGALPGTALYYSG